MHVEKARLSGWMHEWKAVLMAKDEAEWARMSLDSFSVPRDDPDYPSGDYKDPSRYWSERLNIPELHEPYEEVFQGQHAAVQAKIRELSGQTLQIDDRCLPELKRYHALLCACDDRITALPAHTKRDLWHIVMGAVSKFTTSDIGFFMSAFPKRRSFEEDQRKLEIQRKLGYHLEWRLSPETMSLLEEKLGIGGPTSQGRFRSPGP